MKYDIDFPLEDFKRADAMVRATILAQGRVDQWNSARRVTSDLEDLPKYYRDKVTRSLEQEGDNLRAATSPSPNNGTEFDLWFNPQHVENTPRFRATVLHELCHGYIGVGKSHNDQWRRLYTRVLCHYDATVAEIDCWPSLVDLANWRYTKRGRTEATKDFLKRINADKSRWLEQASQEADKVDGLWVKMTR